MGRGMKSQARTRNLHADFEYAFRNRTGEVLSRATIGAILRDTFGTFPAGSVVPTDHAEPSADHVNQCRKCANPDYQIFETVIEGNGKFGVARYRVRAFKSYPNQSNFDTLVPGGRNPPNAGPDIQRSERPQTRIRSHPRSKTYSGLRPIRFAPDSRARRAVGESRRLFPLLGSFQLTESLSI